MNNDLSSTIADARATAARRAADLADQARTWWDRSTDLAHWQAHRMSQGTQRYLRDEPVKSAVTVMALGALVAGVVWWVARRRL